MTKSEMSGYPIEGYWVEKAYEVRYRLLAALAATLVGIARNGMTRESRHEILLGWLQDLRDHGLIDESEYHALRWNAEELLRRLARGEGETLGELAAKIWREGRA